MRIFPLRKEDFSGLRGLFQNGIDEKQLQGRASVDDLLNKLDKGFEARSLMAFADSAQNPNACLIIGHYPGLVTEKVIAEIIFIYIKPELRGDSAIVDSLITIAENYARMNGASYLTGASWRYRDCKGIDALWLSKGFEIQETIYVKNLT